MSVHEYARPLSPWKPAPLQNKLFATLSRSLASSLLLPAVAPPMQGDGSRVLSWPGVQNTAS
eukprot:6196958-Pyramimonas_sp.AAC.1